MNILYIRRFLACACISGCFCNFYCKKKYL